MTALDTFRRRMAGINDLLVTMSVLNWDARVTMPAGGHATRGEQLATLATVIQERFVDDATLRSIDAAEAELSGDARADVDDLRLLYARREVEQAREAWEVLRRIPAELTSELTVQRTVAQPVWAEARRTDDFASFAPYLRRIAELTRELAQCIGFDEHPYDAMLRQYEPGMTASRLARLFATLRETLTPLLARIERSPAPRFDHLLHGDFPIERQRAFALDIARAFGWDPERGRLDESHHPFEISFTRNDVRMTTRYRRDALSGAVFGVFHETGHALYEQNVDPALTRTVLATDLLGMYAVGGTSFGTHESQSRLWENMVGRSQAFWRVHFGALRDAFPTALAGADADQFYRAVNSVRPSPIRVEADEVTYNAHIMLRTEIEMGLLDGSVDIDTLPERWNATMVRDLGITPEDDAQGVLQDIHWSHGHIGTFPTYTVGNVMAAQFFEAATDEVAGLVQDLAAGRYDSLLGWLRENVYRHGRAFLPDELLRRAAGRPLDPEPYRRYLTTKFEALYPGT